MRFIFNEQSNTVRILFRQTPLDYTDSIDLTDQSSPESEVDFITYDGVKIANNLDSDDDFIKNSLLDSKQEINEDFFSQIVDNYSDLVSGDKGDYAFVVNTNKIYTSNYNGDTLTLSWIEVGAGINDYSKPGDENLELEINCSNLLMENADSADYKILPRSDHPKTFTDKDV